MSVFRRPNGAWVAQVYDPKTRRMRQVGTFQTRREALRAEVDASEKRAASGRETVASFAGRWMDDYPRPRESTRRHNSERVQAFAAEHARRRMDSITIDEARAWAHAHKTQLPALRAMFNDARRSGIVTVNPFASLGIERSRGRRDLPSEWLTLADVDHIAALAFQVHGDYGPTMAAIIRFAAYTGVRPGELFALEHDDLGGDTITVRRAADSRTRTIGLPKNGRARTIVYPQAARDAVQQAARMHPDLVFTTPQGRPFWQSSFHYVWSPVRSAAGRPRMALHELRHFCATRLLELGLSPADVAVQLGHTDGGALVMSTYGHPSERAARARIAAAVDGYEAGDVAQMRRARGA
jgi:integrase